MKWIAPEDKLCPEDIDILDLILIEEVSPILIQSSIFDELYALILTFGWHYLQKFPTDKVLIICRNELMLARFHKAIEESSRNNFLSNLSACLAFDLFIPNPNFFDKDNLLIFYPDAQELPINILLELNKKAKRFVMTTNCLDPIFKKNAVFNQQNSNIQDILQFLKPYTKHSRTIDTLPPFLKLFSQILYPGLEYRSNKAGKVNCNIFLGEAFTADDEIDYLLKAIDDYHSIKTSSEKAVLFNKHEQMIKLTNIILKKKNKAPWKAKFDDNGRLNYDDLNKYLEIMSVPIMIVTNSYAALERANEMGFFVFSTYIDIAGLKFDVVFLPFVNQELTFSNNINLTSLLANLLVSAKDELCVTYTGNLSAHFVPILANCNPKTFLLNEEDDDFKF
jgi:hypothetical protein